MSHKKELYPDHLNPFGSDNEEETHDKSSDNQPDEYPDYLSPFGDAEDTVEDDYDASLNPFGCEDSDTERQDSSIAKNKDDSQSRSDLGDGGNPFVDECEVGSPATPEPKSITITLGDLAESAKNFPTESLTNLDCPPIPLPRTKSLLKKELAQKSRQQAVGIVNSMSKQTSQESINSSKGVSTATFRPDNLQPPASSCPPNPLIRNKNKRNAPPVPVNFKRQVCGSLAEIEEELNSIGDSLVDIEKEFNSQQEAAKASYNIDPAKFAQARAKLIEMIKKRSAIVRHQKELMYKKRELKLDQIHSDIEYELRMIGNKQLSNRTADDDRREKELLKSLVEIVEEKSDIVENLNKDTSCDSQEIEETFKRLNIHCESVDNNSSRIQKVHKKNDTSNITSEGENCDRSGLTRGKFSKIATLLPKTGTIKGKIKMKRKRLFKSSNSHTMDQ